ncbi:MAG: hypothetical protein E7592_03345 [Ruminococcaceae bacterium]|nr:hypothetical protein [Oscillospiraceae bacterium]
MARVRRRSRYSRRTVLNRNRSRAWIYIVAIAAFVVLCLMISVGVGLLLSEKAEKYENSPKYDFDSKPYYSGDKVVKPVNARLYSFGDYAGLLTGVGITDFSVCLRAPDGSLTYDTEYDVSFGEAVGEGVSELSKYTTYIHENGGYVCAYFYVTSFGIEDEYLREIYKAYELALISEAARNGADEIMLVGLDVTDDNIDEIKKFVSDASHSAGASILGVLVSPETFKLADEGIYHAARLRSVCDFVALDLRDLPDDADEVEAEGEASLLDSTLGDMEYYISSYSMRIVFSEKNSSLCDAAIALGIENLQIIGE